MGTDEYVDMAGPNHEKAAHTPCQTMNDSHAPRNTKRGALTFLYGFSQSHSDFSRQVNC